MAVDFQVVHPQESIRLDNVRLITYEGLRALRLSGADFRAVDEVIVNDSPSPDVIVLSKNELVAQLPSALQDIPEVRSVMVLSNQFVLSPRSLVRFRIGKTPGRVRGILRLVQLFLKVLFTTPGSDIFHPNAGGGALQTVGSTYGQGEGEGIVTEFVIAINRAQRQLIAMQSRDHRAPRDERLMAASVLSTEFDKLQGGVYITVEIISQAGRRAITNVEL
jgi:hypothetical protein